MPAHEDIPPGDGEPDAFEAYWDGRSSRLDEINPGLLQHADHADAFIQRKPAFLKIGGVEFDPDRISSADGGPDRSDDLQQ